MRGRLRAIATIAVLAFAPCTALAQDNTAPSFAPVTGATWLFSAAACPPWKKIPDDPAKTAAMADACAKDVGLIGDALSRAYAIDPSRRIEVLNAAATGKGVRAGFADLASRVAPGDRVLIYVNTHGGAVEALYRGYQTKDETLAWYTDAEPSSPEAAVEDGDWMSVRELRDLIDDVTAAEIVTIIEACNSAVAWDDFAGSISQSAGVGGRGLDWQGRETVVFSAGSDQVANFSGDGTVAVFTRELAASIAAAPAGTSFAQAFETAQIATNRAVRADCEAGHSYKELLEGWVAYRLTCTQMPVEWDPFGLLDDMVLN